MTRTRQTIIPDNASGVLKDERILAAIPTRVYLDLDPAFTQLWHECEGVDMVAAAARTCSSRVLAAADLLRLTVREAR